MIKALAFFTFPLRGSGIHCDHEVLAGLKSGGSDGFKDLFYGFFVTLQAVWSKSSLIPHSGYIVHLFDKSFKVVEYFRAPPQSFPE